ncbi:CKLF-like MARVEL transmembrane domain-containing protein 8 isoform X2 [Ahaetulla prasina]|uniref:CKLF-like MARVEL transmembrane domain-containing protein 8 isoform X2 n=1 Tax=Ahaetulla prasina TaxID=499056 RepID=UPI0026477D6D|nr:CKLF-like MARVEL transmembrane domain-containing protein 8 isoform X2 [Ahaetulla prasina]
MAQPACLLLTRPTTWWPSAHLGLLPNAHLQLLPTTSAAEQVLGLLVWMLIAGTNYFLYPVFGWIMFVAVFYWILTLFFLIIYMTMTYTKIPQVPWTTVGLYFNGSALLLYLIAAISEACAVTKELDYYNYNSWAASSFFAFVVASCYGGNTYFSFVSWRSRTLQ